MLNLFKGHPSGMVNRRVRFFVVFHVKHKLFMFQRKLLMLYIEKNDKRVNDIIIALNNLIEKPKETKKIGFCTD
jgi:hypothetical protein